MIKESEYAKKNREIDLDFSSDSVKNPESIGLKIKSTDLVETFGHNFELRDTGFSSNDKLLLGEYGGSLDPEYIGDENALKEANMYLARKQLAQSIREEIQKKVEMAGGEEEIHLQISDMLKNNIPSILLEIKKHFGSIDSENIHKRYDDNDLSIIRSSTKEYTMWTRKSEMINKFRDDKEVCPITGAIATIRFSFEIKSLNGLKRLVENTDDIPEVMQLMSLRENRGNSLLNMIDPVSLIGSPFGRKFMCTLALSKRGYTKLIKV